MSGEALSIAGAVTLLRASAEACALEVRGLGVRSTVRPAEGEWCANEVLGHLVEADRRGFGGRLRSIVDEDRPAFTRWA